MLPNPESGSDLITVILVIPQPAFGSLAGFEPCVRRGLKRPSVLFDQRHWVVAHAQSHAAGPQRAGALILPGYVAALENRLWRPLGRGTTAKQRARLEGLLTVPER
jgi:hypothetical protein